ncbi:MAG: hypothetical protein AB8G18_04940 [Gammaproteobacteria bacterium]
MLNIRQLFAALLLSVCSIQAASATTTTYSYTANVSLEIRGNQLATGDQTFYAPGIQVSGSFDYDNTATAIPVPTGGTAYESVFNFNGTIGSDNFSDASGNTFVLNDGLDLDPNDPNNELTDLLSVSAEGGPVTNLNGFSIMNGGTLFTLVNVRLFWISPNGGFVDDELLPGELAPMTELARLALDFVDLTNGANTHTVFADPLVLTASPVPVPAAVWLFVSALGILGRSRKLS